MIDMTGPIPHNLPPYTPSSVEKDKRSLVDPEDMRNKQIVNLIRGYVKTADRETLIVVLNVLRENVWGFQET